MKHSHELLFEMLDGVIVQRHNSASEVEMTKYHNVDKNEILDLAEKFLDDIAASIVKRSYPEHSRASGIEALLRLVHRDLATVDELLSCYR